MAIDRSSQPIVKDAAGVLVGVAQIRVGKSSIRSAGTAEVGTTLTAAGKSTVSTSTIDGTTKIVRPTAVYAANTGTASGVTIGGTYTGAYDGVIVVRINDGATGIEVWGPNNYYTTVASATTLSSQDVKLASATSSGVTITAAIAGGAAGDTWIVPVWAGSSLNKPQTGIVHPYSPFLGSGYSIGGLKSAGVTPKIGSVKKLESGFPSYVSDQIIDTTSVSVSFEALEYTNSNMNTLKDMMRKIINEGSIAAVPVEAVMRTRGGTLVTFFIPSATMSAFPDISPSNDYSSLKYELEALKQSQVTAESQYYITALEESYLYSELYYTH